MEAALAFALNTAGLWARHGDIALERKFVAVGGLILVGLFVLVTNVAKGRESDGGRD